jgi:hypothetical protein
MSVLFERIWLQVDPIYPLYDPETGAMSLDFAVLLEESNVNIRQWVK